MATIVREIGIQNGRWLAAFRQRDATALATVYTADARLMPPGAPPVQGRAAIQTWWQTLFESQVCALYLETLDIEAHSATLSYEVGVYTGGREGTPMAQSGKYVVIWRYDGTLWHMDTVIWNSDAAPKYATSSVAVPIAKSG